MKSELKTPKPSDRLEWTKEDTAFIKATMKTSSGSKSTSLEELIKLHKSLPY
jgi:hypothetical protein